MPPAERRALLLLLGLAVAGHAVRFVVTRPSQAPGEVELVKTLPAQSPLAHKDSTVALARPLGPGERIDIDRAGPAEIARLPRVGPGLAKRIVADRSARGPFGSLEGLDRVPGVGAALLAAIADHAAFSGPGPASSALAVQTAPGWRGSSAYPGAQEVCSGAVTGCALVPGPLPADPSNRVRLSLNTATVAQLDSLPGIGAKRAEAIVHDRDRNGPFPSVEALTRVPGIKPALVARVRQRLQVP
jgi:competence ComEA-like helix-hairpin-helix protein